MTPNAFHLLLAALGMVLLTFVVGTRMLYCRVQEIRRKRLHPQIAATSQTLAGRLENVQAADNFRNLFETPVLFLRWSLARLRCRMCRAVASRLHDIASVNIRSHFVTAVTKVCQQTLETDYETYCPRASGY